jgi:hypothetical protein
MFAFMEAADAGKKGELRYCPGRWPSIHEGMQISLPLQRGTGGMHWARVDLSLSLLKVRKLGDALMSADQTLEA